MMLQKKVLIFDLGGVIIDLHVNRSFGALAAMGVAPQLLSESGSAVNEVMALYDRGDITTGELFERMASLVPQTGRDGSGSGLHGRMAEIWNMMLGDFPVGKLRRLKELRAKGYRVVMLSNTNEAHWPEIERKFLETVGCSLECCFDALYLSFRMRCRKPEPEIFLRLLENEGVAASECLFFDDSAVNCDAARQVGIESVLVERNVSSGEFLKNVCL